MKIVLVNRRQRPDAFSIEELFRVIGAELRKHVEVIEYEVGERRDVLRDARALRRLAADVYHVTGDVNYFVPLLPRGRAVLTVHDIGHLLNGVKGWRKPLYRLGWFKVPLASATAVTCVSADTRDRLVQEFRMHGDVPVVIENCHSPLFHPTPQEFNKLEPRILQVGTKPYKNVPRLVRALQGMNCTLVLIGKLDAETLAALAEARVPYENLVNLSQQDLVAQYRRADLVTFASTGEGFGVPIIEAQAMGRPLVTSAVSPLREVAGPEACLVDPLSCESIREGIVRIVEDDAYRSSVVAAGIANVRRYSPEQTATRYLDVYRQVCRSVHGLPVEGSTP